MGWGGNTNSLPNHLQDLVFWNRARKPIEPGVRRVLTHPTLVCTPLPVR